MKLVLIYSENSYEYCHENIICIEYESAEACLCDFEEKLDEALKNDAYNFEFCNKNFHVRSFYNVPLYSEDNNYYKYLPDIFELNEWFENNKICQI
jgi:hypothetical protein